MSEVTEKIFLILLTVSIIFIIAGVIWAFISVLGPIPIWGWLIIIGLAILGFFYIMSRVIEVLEE
jgi:hypothetical protein